VRVLDVAHGLPNLPGFFIPSLACFDRKGNLLLGHVAAGALATADWRAGLTHFKMLMAGRVNESYRDRQADDRFKEHAKRSVGENSHCSPDTIAASFLAYAMRRARLRLAAAYPSSKLDIAFNVCVPIDQRENNEILEKFRRVVQIAEVLDRGTETSAETRWWMDQAARLLADGYEVWPESRVFVIPEAIAGVAAYLTSLQRRDGLHALIDIGSGTTDISIFSLGSTGKQERGSEWLAALSIPRGASLVENEVTAELAKRGLASVTRDDLVEVMAGRHSMSDQCASRMEEALTSIWMRSHRCWAMAYGKRRRQQLWERQNVREFLSGGGGLIPAAKRIFATAWEKKWGPYPCVIVPEPDDYARAATGIPFARLCVAYGLCTPEPELEAYVLPADAPDRTPPPPPHLDYYHRDGDQLVPTSGWLSR
jgi:hypothetical protein